MDGKMLARVGAIAFVAVAITAIIAVATWVLRTFFNRPPR